MHTIADTKMLVEEGVISRSAARIIEERARSTMVTLAINTVLALRQERSKAVEIAHRNNVIALHGDSAGRRERRLHGNDPLRGVNDEWLGVGLFGNRGSCQ